ncbi:type II toxin-antitoxin system RelB/DinJ family antitoxin [Peptoniphilus rachelemmaiella]|uniref:type II toxin-antitoxin system RelB/DinJ family antitoxin n=1 Tax=Peptoniphilus rachelemmaiella TaxID=2811779 RepID=UPI00203F3F8B|nr:type II toxin-antitoxin system RelB/DinJ family antitoxin [Peptoniphilus rachelemmaiella]
MSKTTTFSVRMDKQVKQDSEQIFQELGMNLTTAINVFLRQAVRTGGFPFEVKLEQPNKTTMQAIQEANLMAADPDTVYYSDVEEALAELNK